MTSEMLTSGLNNIAVALIFRKLITLGIECTMQVFGSEMNHKILIVSSTGVSFEIENSKQWFETYQQLRMIKNKKE